ncbi:concanavalin A-like lectin/glucanase domain-containing protein [Chlamydoabsidia padenii]|nr:concanavalin A-like lectin/glucanase domain-containing protein [Chlamydoabsidia padenii]
MDSLEEEPPSYDHAVQSTLDSTQVSEFGKYNDASVDSFERGELFIQAFRSHIDHYPTELAKTMQTQGPVYQSLDLDIHNNTVFRHPLWTQAYPGFQSNGSTLIQFWPQGTASGQDTDLTIQGTLPFVSFHQPTVHYFEVTVDDKQDNTVVSIGLATRPYPLFRMPGWNKHSVGYFSDDGNKFCDDPSGGQTFGPAWTKGDTVGCAYAVETGTVSFTLNGHLVGHAFSGLESHVYYPSVASDGPASVRVNFGATPFKYPCQDWIGYHHHHSSG